MTTGVENPQRATSHSVAPDTPKLSAAATEGEAGAAALITCTATRHGTRGAYVAGCRCPEARRANREYAYYRKQRTAQAAFGAAKPFSVPVVETRSVVDQLRGVGWTLRRIEAATGIKRDHLSRINGQTQRPLRHVRWATHHRLAALLDVDPVVADGALVDAYPTWQRVRGLIALGYPKAWIARALGNDRALQLGRHVVTAGNAEKVRVLADRYGGERGPSQRARVYAAARGWTADLIWQADGEPEEFFHTFNTNSSVDPVAVDRFLSGDPTVTLTRAEKQCAYDEMRARGISHSRAAAHLGWSGTTALKHSATVGVRADARAGDAA